jgi:predicted alpha-1,6-mannanase (GH76 family)
MRPVLRPARALWVVVAGLMALAALSVPASASTPAKTPSPSASTAAPAAPAANTSICDTYCDGRDPALATQERIPVSISLAGRTIGLHLSDNDVMGWAATGSGGPGDEVWLDRSFDGGRTWSSGSKLGDTSAPAGTGGWRTQMYNVDDWNNSGVGALRACGQPAGQSGIACTAWARVNRNAWSRPTAAATGMMMFYNRGNGLFDTTGWWNSANALTAVIDNARVTGLPSYTYALSTTYADQGGGNFTNGYIDDTGWWGLAWLDAYALTGDSRYLTTARADADYMANYWDSTCGGGVWWSTAKTYKNAIANELYLELNAGLHNYLPGDTTYLNRAQQEWTWFSGTGLINGSHLVNDGLDTSTCGNNGQITWTYNQGVVLGGLTELYHATGQTGLLDTARQIADAATTSGYLNPGGVLTEPCEGGDCGGDGPSFKGAFVRGLGGLNAALAGHPYSTYLHHQADAAYGADRDTLDIYGLHWAGPRDKQDGARQQSALDLMNAAVDPSDRTGRITGYGGLCVDDASSSTADYNPVQVWTCNGTGAQNWTVGADRTLRVFGKCLDVYAAGTANGSKVELYTCNGTAAQVWIPQPGGALLNPPSGRCLDDTGWATTPGAQLELWDCTGAANQKWALP